MPESDLREVHRSVLLDETLSFLEPENGGLYVDATLGIGGHSEAILKASAETRIIGIDQDEQAIGLAAKRLAPFGERV